MLSETEIGEFVFPFPKVSTVAILPCTSCLREVLFGEILQLHCHIFGFPDAHILLHYISLSDLFLVSSKARAASQAAEKPCGFRMLRGASANG